MDLTKFNQIIEGWRNTVVPPKDLKKLINYASKMRLDKCEGCSYHSKNHKSNRPDAHCTNCGCTLIAKTKCLSCKCPLEVPLWDKIEVKT